MIPNALGDDARPLRHRERHADLRLHIGREAGVRLGLDVGAAETPRRADEDGFAVFLHRDAHFAEFRGDAVKVLGNDVFDQDFSPDGGGGGHVGAGLDLVGNDGVGAAVELLHAVDLDGVRTGAANVRAHGVEEVGKIDDVRLARRVFDDRASLGEHGGDHNVHRRADGDLIEIYARAAQPSAGDVRGDEIGNIDLRAEGVHALDVLVDRPDAEVAAARHRRAGNAEPAEHRADKIVRRADLAHAVIVRAHPGGVRRVDLHGGAVDLLDLRAERFENEQQRLGIADLGQVFNAAFAVYHERRRNDGYRRILRAADLHFAVQTVAASDSISFQVLTPPDAHPGSGSPFAHRYTAILS